MSDVADLIQLNNLSFSAATLSALNTFEDLFARNGILGLEKQVGLFGELLFLESCLKTITPDAAIAAWKGCDGNEHDFVIAGACFEIKSTTSEKRRHQITSLEQLNPSPGLPLWLISVQLTSASPSHGRTLTQLIEDVRDASGGVGGKLERMLVRAGWRERDRSAYQEHFTLRSVPAAYLVDHDFPALNRRIIQLSCANPSMLLDATYAVDITSLKPAEPPAPANHFVSGSI
ncbi:PD-(D/E)XK motif protein [Solwaraspora sp. WMMA2059]|nr:PD-(D/E)XK motif protein [Solwaraspora sp. WMMA2059]WBB96396.1 PD-(D/E)XK motif protein [Solwaraspora sp. WMMA2059]